MVKETVDKYFDYTAAGYNEAYENVTDVRSFIFKERKRIALDMFTLKKGRVLDIGCGPAVYTDRLLASGHEVYGVDVSEKMITLAESKGFKNAHFFVGTAEKLDFPDRFFDGALCIGVLEYLDSFEEAIKETARVIRDGGIAIFTVPNAASLLNQCEHWLRAIVKAMYKLFRMKMIKSLIDFDYHSRSFYKEELEGALKRSGFEIEESCFHIFRMSFLNKISPAIAFAIVKRMNFISSRFFAANYIVKCRKVC